MENAKTGDVLLFCCGGYSTFKTKFFINSPWHHLGMAVRVHNDEITLDTSGKLYVFEIAVTLKHDYLTNSKRIGVVLADFETVENSYNIIALRKLKDKYRNKEFISKIETFIEKYKDYHFPKKIISTLSICLGKVISSERGENDIFCSELIAKLYQECLDIKDVFGESILKIQYCIDLIILRVIHHYLKEKRK